MVRTVLNAAERDLRSRKFPVENKKENAEANCDLFAANNFVDLFSRRQRSVWISGNFRRWWPLTVAVRSPSTLRSARRVTSMSAKSNERQPKTIYERRPMKGHLWMIDLWAYGDEYDSLSSNLWAVTSDSEVLSDKFRRLKAVRKNSLTIGDGKWNKSELPVDCIFLNFTHILFGRRFGVCFCSRPDIHWLNAKLGKENGPLCCFTIERSTYDRARVEFM